MHYPKLSNSFAADCKTELVGKYNTDAFMKVGVTFNDDSIQRWPWMEKNENAFSRSH